SKISGRNFDCFSMSYEGWGVSFFEKSFFFSLAAATFARLLREVRLAHARGGGNFIDKSS
ncbi:MAG: hypothetical protein AAFY48_12065, partial [Bacteroidota bacterium]